MTLLSNSRYAPAHGGHAPKDLHEAKGIEACRRWKPGEPEPTVEIRDEDVTIGSLCGLLWNCSDYLSGSDATLIEVVCGSRPGTYGAAARALKNWAGTKLA